MDEIRQALFELTRVSEQLAILSAYAIGGTAGEVIDDSTGDPGNGAEESRTSDPKSNGAKKQRKEIERDDNTTRLALMEMAINTLRNCSCATSSWAYPDPRWLGFAEPKHSKISNKRVVAADDGPKLPPSEFASFFRSNPIDKIRFGPDRSPEPQEPKMKLILSPSDGLEDLYGDHVGGAVSVIAGGPPDFVRDIDNDAWFRAPERFADRSGGNGGKRQSADQKHQFQRYIVLVVPRGPMVDQLYDKFQFKEIVPRRRASSWTLNHSSVPTPLCHCPHLRKLMHDELPKAVLGLRSFSSSSEALPLRVGAIGSDLLTFGYAPLLEQAYVRRFPGSRFAAGLATLIDRFGIDMFFGVVRETTAVLLSIAAVAFDGALVAVPVEPLTKAVQATAGCNLGVSPGRNVLCADDFVDSTKPMMLVASGITDHPVLRGVRFLRTGEIRTQTMTINLPSRSVRWIDHNRKLSTDVLYRLTQSATASVEERTANAAEVIKKFREDLRSRLNKKGESKGKGKSGEGKSGKGQRSGQQSRRSKG